MERLKSLGSILVLILILIALALVAVIWPMIVESLNFAGVGSFFGGAARPATETAPIVIPIPEPIASAIGMNELVLQGFVAFAALAAIVIGSVVIFGLIITLLMRLGGKFTGEVAEDEEYQKHVANLETKEKETLKVKRGAAPAPNQPEGYVYGLDPMSFSMLVLFFMAMLGVLVATFGPETVDVTLFGNVYPVSTSMLTLFVLSVITIPVLVWRVRRSRIDAIADKDYAPIPWDFIAVLITGLLVVGVGLGIMLYINRPM